MGPCRTFPPVPVISDPLSFPEFCTGAQGPFGHDFCCLAMHLVRVEWPLGLTGRIWSPVPCLERYTSP